MATKHYGKDFKAVLDHMMKMSGKSLNDIAQDGGLDRVYLFRLYHGERRNPSPEVITWIWIGVIFDRRLLDKDLTMLYGLADLAGAAAVTMGAAKLLG